MAFRQADGRCRLGQARFRQRLLVAGADQRVRARAARRPDGRRAARRQPAQRRSAVGGAVQGQLLDCDRDAALRAADNLLFVSAEYNGGAKVIELQREGLQTKATELWSNNRLRLHHGNAIRVGEAIYFSSGGKGSQAILSRGRCAQRQDPLAGAQHRESHVRVGRRQADHARPGRHPDDRLSVAAGLQDRREGAAPDRVCRGRRRCWSARASTCAIAAR